MLKMEIGVLDNAIVAAVAAAIGIILTKGVEAVIHYRKAKQEVIAQIAKIDQELRHNDSNYLFGHYRQLVDDLTESVERMSQEVNKLQREHLDCRIENASLKSRITSLELQVIELQSRLGVTDDYNHTGTSN